MRARRSETTTEILSLLSRRGKLTAEQVSERIDATRTNASSILLRLLHSGDVERTKIQQGVVVIDDEENVTRPRHVFSYAVTKKGRGRLAILRERAS